MTETGRLVGQQINQYRVTQFLAQGGMAEVYLAEDTTLQRTAVLKVMLPALANNPTFLERFRREAQATAQLEHPNIVRIYGTGVTPDKRPFLAMQYIPGGSLQQHLQQLADKGQTMPIGQLLHLTRQIATALQTAHAHGITHRDLKPSNILLGNDGTPFLADLGLAAMQSASRLTRTDQIMGTPHYMSPEQITGGKADGRSDLYALGVILYEMLIGTVPFQGSTAIMVLHQHVNEPPPSLLLRRPGLPQPLYNLVDRCLQKQPEQRFQTAQQVVAILDQLLATTGSGIAAKPAPPPPLPLPTTPTLPQIQPSLHPAIYAVGAVAFLLVVFGLWQLLGSNREPLPMAELPTATATVESPATKRAVPTPTPTSVAANVAPTATSAPLLPTATPTDEPTPTPGVPTGRIVFDVATGNILPEIYIMNADGSNPTRLTFNDYQDDEADLSPDGRFIAYESRGSGQWMIMVMGSDGSNPITLVPGRLPDWSPNGRYIAYETVEAPQRIGIYDVQSGSTRLLTSTNQNSRSPSWSPDSQKLVIMADTSNGWQLAIVDASSGAQQFITSEQGSKRFPAWSPTGDLIAFNTVAADNSNPDHIWVIDTSGDNLRQLTQEGKNGRPTWSPDGRFLVYNSNLSGSWLLYRIRLDGSERTALTSGGNHQRADWGN